MSFRVNQFRDSTPDPDAPTPSAAVLADQAVRRDARDAQLRRRAASQQRLCGGATKSGKSDIPQGCQIYSVQNTKTLENITKYHKIY
jgi:hypothetical protein